MNQESILATGTCVPCRGDVARMDRATARERIGEVDGWTLNDDATRIERTFEFADFATALAFAERVGALAEEQFHHPEITVGWGRCRVMYQTTKIRGLHGNDFIMAARVNALRDSG